MIVGKHTELVKSVVTRLVKKGKSRNQALHSFATRLNTSARHLEEQAKKKAELYEGVVNPVVAREIEHLQKGAATERERIQEVEKIASSGWQPEA